MQLLAVAVDKAECDMIKNACKGVGTDALLLYSVIYGRTNEENDILKKKFFKVGRLPTAFFQGYNCHFGLSHQLRPLLPSNMTKIFGPNIATLKGKTTCRTPAPVEDDMIAIPHELVDAQHLVTLCIDDMKVNGLHFLTTTSNNFYYRTAENVRHQTSEVYLEKIQSILNLYQKGGFRVTSIWCDNEFRPLLEQVASKFQVAFNYANPQEHVPKAEQNNCVIKERVRAYYLHTMKLTKTMVKTMVSEAAKKFNFFPAKNGVSPYYSPRMILHQQNLDYLEHCAYSLGAYVQAHDKPAPTNTQAPQTLNCIYLRHSESHQDRHKLLNLPYNMISRRKDVTHAPISPAILEQVNALATTKGIPKGLKIKNKTGSVLFDSALTAEVDFDEELFSNKDYDSSEEDNSIEEDLDQDFDEIEPDEIFGLGDNSGTDNTDSEGNSNNQNKDPSKLEEEIDFDSVDFDSVEPVVQVSDKSVQEEEQEQPSALCGLFV